MNRDQFLQLVSAYIKTDPEAAAFIPNAVAAGLSASRQSALERAADMEVALSVALAKRYKGREALILSKLHKWRRAGALCWDETIKRLELQVMQK